MLTIASQTFLGPRGGISRVAELTARVAIEAGHCTSLLSVESEGGNYQHSDCWRGFGGSRLKFVMACGQAGLRGNRILYDQLGTARANTLWSWITPFSGVWLHGIEVWEQLRRDRLRAAYSVGFMLANTSYTRQRAMKQDRIFETAQVCWLGTYQDEPPASPALLDGPPTVLILGRLDDAAYKGHKELITAWPSVVKGVPGARLTIVGGGPLIEHYRSMAASSKAGNNIDIIGFVTEAGLERLWKQTVVFAMPSRGEGFGLAYIEAMRWRIPIIASIHDAGSEINIDGETGFNVDLAHPKELTEALVALLRDRDVAARLGAAGQRRWQEQFCYSAFRERFAPKLTWFLSS